MLTPAAVTDAARLDDVDDIVDVVVDAAANLENDFMTAPHTFFS